MTGNVHQDDEDKLKGTVKQKEKDRTVTGTVTANAGTNLDTSGLLTESDFDTRVGEVQADPTANTLLARLKAIEDFLDTIDTDTGNIDTKLGDIDTVLDNIKVDTTSLDGKIVTDKTADYDTGAGTDTVRMNGVALPKSGGAVPGGTSTDPFRTDPTGTTTQPTSEQGTPTIKPNALKILDSTSYDVDAIAVQVVDASAHANMVMVTICNAGTGNIYLYKDDTAGPYVQFRTLAQNETWEFPLAYTSDTTNDIWAERAGLAIADNVIVVKWEEA